MKSKKIKKMLYLLLNMVVLIGLFSLSVYAEDPTYQQYTKGVDKIKNILTGIFAFIGLISAGFGIMMYRKKVEERTEELSSVFWIFVGVFVISISGTVVTWMFF
ncbi:hypothetical protein SH1V18_47910 [Vallitalea longa]|uniref:Uncharacterized protein n=1 Tax=Vallitalea longa TaxID=2936439 RepID=A0A9W6DGH6_9FIRM|nr:TrbC/VirB2 family protein [Vallitalea longa]GKX32311.1 hypothetical protein SH1V18_47910 [Vallitalea longa]